MKKIFLITTILICAQYLMAQTINQSAKHNIRETTYTSSGSISNITYYDNLGKPMQSVMVKGSPSGKDIVSFYVYDCMGRGDSISYLPYPTTQTGGNMKVNPLVSQQAYYNSEFIGDPDRAFAFSRKEYDKSPAGLVLKQGGAGQSRNIDISQQGHPVAYEYRRNTEDDKVKKLVIDASTNTSLTFSGYYPADKLTVKKSQQQNLAPAGAESYEYYDGNGHLVAKETKTSSGKLYTYYVFDDMGRQRYIIPPAQDSLLTSSATYTTSQLSTYSYYYEYDKYGNVSAMRTPGSSTPYYYIYDKRGRLVLSQEPRQYSSTAANNEYFFTKYDEYDRPIMTGTIKGKTQVEHTAAMGMITVWGEKRGTALHGYTNSAYPAVTANDVLTVTYYDDYNWIQALPASPAPSKYSYSSSDAIGNAKSDNIVGLVTGTKTKVLGITTNQWLVSAVYYDSEYRTVQSVSDLYVKDATVGTEIVSNSHDIYSGNVLRTKVKQTVGSLTHEYNKWFTYDNRGRLNKVEQQITGDADNGKVTLAAYTYNELGQLLSKKVHNNLDQTTYRYSIAGANISSTSPHFSYTLGFDKTVITGHPVKHDGNLSAVTWRSSEDNVTKGYRLSHNTLGRLTDASYATSNGTSWTTVNPYKESVSGYDVNGNITRLTRNGSAGTPTNNLTYTYTGNRLSSLTDAVANQTYTYTYDLNGNLTSDSFNGAAITYNKLNLPETILANSAGIKYIYSAAGEKLAAEVGSSLTYYRGPMVYAKNGTAAEQLSYMLQPEGLVEKAGTAYTYKYFKTDHVGSTRVVLAAVKSGGTTTLQAKQYTNYYPYGLPWATNNLNQNKYLFSGKEYQDASVGGKVLGLYDFGSRFYNPILGRWFNPDPRMQMATPYGYCGNSPLMYQDPDGEWFFAIIIGAAISTITNGISNSMNDRPFFENAGTAALIGGIGGGFSFGIGELAKGLSGFGKIAFQTGAHGHLGGLMSAATGGDYGAGFMSGAFGSLAATGAGSLMKNASFGAEFFGMTAVGGLTGGIGAGIAGGNFWDGARNGAISAGLNHGLHGIRDERLRLKHHVEAAREFLVKEGYSYDEVAADITYHESGSSYRRNFARLNNFDEKYASSFEGGYFDSENKDFSAYRSKNVHSYGRGSDFALKYYPNRSSSVGIVRTGAMHVFEAGATMFLNYDMHWNNSRKYLHNRWMLR